MLYSKLQYTNQTQKVILIKLVIRLSSNVGPDIKHIGQKAQMLIKIHKLVDIPKGIVLDTSVFDSFMEANDCEKYLEEVYENNLLNIINFKKVISKGKFDNSLYFNILNSLKPLKGPFAVRSSCTSEDSKKFSFAGIFDSILSVKKENLMNVIKKIYSSLYSNKSIAYFNANGLDMRNAKMAVIIQEMAKSSKFGVCFSFTKGNKRITIIENAFGKMNAVTAGKGNIDRYIIQDSNIEKYPHIPDINSLFNFEILELQRTVKKLSKIVPQLDMEYCISKESGLKILQLRPLTSDIILPQKGKSLTGIPVSSGEVIGKAIPFEDGKSIPPISKKIILCTDEISIDHVAILKKVGGLLLDGTGITSHAAILSREYGIPCVSGMNGIMEIIKSGEKIYLNGSSGEVKFLNRKNFSFGTKSKKSMFIFDHTKFDLYRYNCHSLMTYPIHNAIAVSYSISDPNKVEDAIKSLQKKSGKQCVDLGSSIYHDINFMMDLKSLNSGPFKQMINVWKTLDSIADTKKFFNSVKLNMDLARKNLKNSERLMQIYHTSDDKKSLIEALEYADYAFAYWKVIDAVILRSKPAELILLSENNKNTKKFERVIIKLQTDKDIIKIGNDVVSAVNNILVEITNSLKINKTYSSKSTFILDLKARFRKK